jgi:glycosyltransferase involved in cell wall biosynthesis
LPYIVLEAIAARLPIVAANVGGIPEIFGPQAHHLVPSDDPRALARAMFVMKTMDEDARKALADELAAFVRQRFTLSRMAEGVLRGYRDALRRTPSLEPDSVNTLPRHV